MLDWYNTGLVLIDSQSKVMAPKLQLTPEERKQLRALKKAEKKQRQQEKKKQLKRELLDREIRYGAVTLKRQEKNWRQLLIGIKVPEMRKELEFAWHHFERLVDCKDFAISLLLDELDKAHGQYFLNLKTHSEHIDQLLQMFGEQVQQLQQDYNNQVGFNSTSLVNLQVTPISGRRAGKGASTQRWSTGSWQQRGRRLPEDRSLHSAAGNEGGKTHPTCGVLLQAGRAGLKAAPTGAADERHPGAAASAGLDRHRPIPPKAPEYYQGAKEDALGNEK